MPRSVGELEVDLTTNAIAFFTRGIATTSNPGTNIQQLAFAVVDIAGGVELLLKARLAREHWALIVSNVDKAEEAGLLSGTSSTVTPEQTIVRLSRIAGVTFKQGSTDHAKELQGLVKLRNRAAHFTLADQHPTAIRSQLANALRFVLWFLDEEFRDRAKDPARSEVQDLVEDLVETISGPLGQIQELVAGRRADIEAEVNAAAIALECPRCSQPALITQDSDGSITRCAFCIVTWLDGESAAAEYADSVLGVPHHIAVSEGGDWPVRRCPECGHEALVAGIHQVGPPRDPLPDTLMCDWDPIYHFGCFACGYLETTLYPCDYCAELTSEPGTCASCIEIRIARF